MNRLFTTVLIAVFCISGKAQSSNKISLLILSGKNNHEWKKTTPYLANMYKQTGLFEVEISENPEALEAEKIATYDVIVSNWSSFPDREYRWPRKAEEALIEFIKKGGGFVTFHASATAFYEWPEFKEISTGAWVDETSHGKICTARVTITDGEHPITNGMRNFTIFDELWMKAEQNVDFSVLAGAVNENTKKAGLGAQPVVSVMEYGKGRVFHNALGHELRNMRNSGFQTLMLRGTEWAATGKVKQKSPRELQAIVMADYKFSEADSFYASLNGKRVLWHSDFREKHQKTHFHPVFIGGNNINLYNTKLIISWEKRVLQN